MQNTTAFVSSQRLITNLNCNISRAYQVISNVEHTYLLHQNFSLSDNSFAFNSEMFIKNHALYLLTVLVKESATSNFILQIYIICLTSKQHLHDLRSI